VCFSHSNDFTNLKFKFQRMVTKMEGDIPVIRGQTDVDEAS
jgi:hypothetical protein